MKTKLLVIAATAMLAGCAVFRSNNSSSWVDGVSESDAAPLSAQIADLTAGRIARGEKVRLAAPHDNAASEAVDAGVKNALTERGIGIAGEDDGEGAHTLRYIVTRYGGDLLLRVRLDEAEAATVLVRDASGAFVERAPLSVRKVSR
jgi:outer membrane murein-binding lipoprotein Lpp